MKYEVITAIQQALTAHNLSVTIRYDSAIGHVFRWENGFNKSHIVELVCLHSGLVVGKATDTNNPEWKKDWWVSEFCPVVEYAPMYLSLDETIEYIRHFIWANHGEVIA